MLAFLVIKNYKLHQKKDQNFQSQNNKKTNRIKLWDDPDISVIIKEDI